MTQGRRRFLKAFGATAVALASFSLGGPLLASVTSVQKKRIGVVGSGRVGSALGSVWVNAGHEVMFSSRHIENDRALAERLGRGTRAGTPREAAEFGEVVMISVPYHALPDVGKELGDLLEGRIVIDTCNPFVHRDGEIANWAREKGAGLASAELLPGARIVRAFNAVGYARMGAAHEEPGRFGMPIASDDAEAVAIVSPLIRDIGYEPVLIGGLESGRHLMPGTPLAGERAPEEVRRIAASLD